MSETKREAVRRNGEKGGREERRGEGFGRTGMAQRYTIVRFVSREKGLRALQVPVDEAVEQKGPKKRVPETRRLPCTHPSPSPGLPHLATARVKAAWCV
jgi:hypothetical protein